MLDDKHHGDHTTPQPAAWALALLFAAGAALFRVVPYEWSLGPAAQWVWNFAPIGALALYAGARLRPFALAMLVPLAAMLASDLYLLNKLGPVAFGWSRLVVYACF